MSRSRKLWIPGPVGKLEAVLRVAETPVAAAVFAHPHPQQGGTMHNTVIFHSDRELNRAGWTTLRFNFRGVGKSEGEHDDGRGEFDDARAAWHWMREKYPRARRWLAGFSFGSWVAARLAASEADVEHLLLIAPPVTRSGFDVLKSTTVPKLIIQGTADDVCPIEALETQLPAWAEPKKVIRVVGASHFFDKQLAQLGKAVLEGMPST